MGLYERAETLWRMMDLNCLVVNELNGLLFEQGRAGARGGG